MPTDSTTTYSTKLRSRHWLTPATFELELSKPRFFEFSPGQRIRLVHEGTARDYSLISAPDDPALALCVRKVEGGTLSHQLAVAEIGSTVHFTGPHGYFTFRRSLRPAVFVATGVGISPFVSMVKSGVRISTLLHGVRLPAELYYQAFFRGFMPKYVPCLSAPPSETELPCHFFQGRVTAYLQKHLQTGIYDLYLCGRSEMVRDVTLLVDELFPGSHIYAEIFY
jgi:benzoate/toluate 1,2-dioxygenase reductase component